LQIEIKELHAEAQSLQQKEEQLQSKMKQIGIAGLSRVTLCSNSWYEKNKRASLYHFGLPSWQDGVVLVTVIFPDIELLSTIVALAS
jgi:hypothetical protein